MTAYLQIYGPAPRLAAKKQDDETSIMFLKTSFTSLIVGVFVVYVLHTCWVMYGIVYTKPCDSPKGENCFTPYLAQEPKLQVSDVQRSARSDGLSVAAHMYFMNVLILAKCVCVQLSIYTVLRPDAEGGHTLIHKEETFDVNSKFERSVSCM